MQETTQVQYVREDQVARLTLYWGGPQGVARRRPAHPGNPSDPAYDWSAYDAIVKQLHAAGIQPLLGILGTPPWANKAKGLACQWVFAQPITKFNPARPMFWIMVIRP